MGLNVSTEYVVAFFMMSLTLFQKEDGSFITCEGNGYWGFMCVQIEDFVNV